MKDSLAFKLSLQKLFDCLLSWPEQKEKKNGYYGFFIILKNPLETEKKYFTFFGKIRIFARFCHAALPALMARK